MQTADQYKQSKQGKLTTPADVNRMFRPGMRSDWMHGICEKNNLTDCSDFIKRHIDEPDCGITRLLKDKVLCGKCRIGVKLTYELQQYAKERLSIRLQLHTNCDNCVNGLHQFIDRAELSCSIYLTIGDGLCAQMIIGPSQNKPHSLAGYLTRSTIKKLFRRNINSRLYKNTVEILNIDNVLFSYLEDSDLITGDDLYRYNRFMIKRYAYHTRNMLDSQFYNLVEATCLNRQFKICCALYEIAERISRQTDFATLKLRLITYMEAMTAEYKNKLTVELAAIESSDGIPCFPDEIMDIVFNCDVYSAEFNTVWAKLRAP